MHKFVEASRAADDGRVFFYQPPLADQAFVLGLTSRFFANKAAELGHERAVLMDATFGMNHNKVCAPTDLHEATASCRHGVMMTLHCEQRSIANLCR